MVKKVRTGLFTKRTKYKPVWCNHADWITLKALTTRLNCTMIQLQHTLIETYLTCKEQNHQKQIDDLADKVDILAAEVLKYRNKFGRLPP